MKLYFGNEDVWEKYFIRFEDVTCDIIPVGCVLTMVGTGSEMNGGSVITNRAQKLKIGHVYLLPVRGSDLLFYYKAN